MPARKRRKGRREPNAEGRSHPLLCSPSKWDDWFFNYHDLAGKADTPAIEAKRKLGCVEDELTLFLQDSEEFTCSCAALIKRHCKGFSLKSVEDGVGLAGTRVAAWIDDRNSPDLKGSGTARVRKDWLTATGLLRYFKKPRYNNVDEPDAARRLLYIENLTPDFILALAVTASFYQTPILRDAMYKHLALEPSIQVTVSSVGLPSFQMEFHLPFFALRKLSQSESSCSKVCERPARMFKDFHLSKEGSAVQNNVEKYRLHYAQVSCVVYGHDEWQYTVYAFKDTEHDENYDIDSTNHSQNDAFFTQEEIDEDPLASCLNANRFPIWRPRQYFLRAFEAQIQEPEREWDDLVHRLVVDITEYKHAHQFIWSTGASRSPKERGDEMKTSFDWTLQRMQLLSELIVVLSGNIDKWDAFSSRDSDINYFSDIDKVSSNSPEFKHGCYAGPSLRRINKTFKKFETHRQKLKSLKKDLSTDFEALKLRLSLEGNDAQEHASFTSKFLIWVLYPITLAASIFSMQPTVIPFGLTPTWFCITVFILVGLMFTTHWIMKNWALWQKRAATWIKVFQEARRAPEREYQNDVILGEDIYFHMSRRDENGSLGTRVVLRGSDVV